MHTQSPQLKNLAQQISTFPDIVDLLSRAIIENPPVVIRDGGVIAEGYDAELDELRNISTNAGQYLLDLEREAFLSLCTERKTLERIQFMLTKGKPLRN